MRDEQSSTSTSTLSKFQANPEIWYKIHTYSMISVTSRVTGPLKIRTLATTDELYISDPYFSSAEATIIKNTLVSPPSLNEIPEFESLSMHNPNEVDESSSKELPTSEIITIETAIKYRFQNLFEKRRASGEARRCGPHDIGPICRAVFGITKEDLKNEKFLSSLRRVGLGQSREKDKYANESVSGRKKKEKNGKKG